MTDKKDGQLTKRVDFVAKDEDEQIATGIVMVPDKVDLQRDFVREDTIRQFADQFGDFMEVGQADGGLMHAVWPSDWMELERNEVLDEAEEIGGEQAPAGAWIQSWRFNDDDLWQLVNDGLLPGFSIGAVNVQWGGPYEQDELDDVDVPSEIDDDALVWELVSGIIREVSSVDIPAVPDAQVLETKADAEKRLADHLGNRDAFIEEALERNPDWSEDDAEQLWDVLNRAIDVEGSGEPGKQSMFARIGKAAVNAFTGSDDDGASKTSEGPDRGRDRGSEKEGRTLSTANEHSLYASVDASLDVLEDAGIDHGMTRFTDRDDVDFDLTEHSARDWPKPDEDEEDSDASDAAPDSMTESAAGGDTPENDGGTEAADDTDMTDDTTETEPPEWAKDLKEQLDEQSKRIDEIAGDGDGEEEKDAWEDAPEWAQDLKERQDKNAERIDAISKQTGTDSQQLGKGAGEEEKDNDFTLDPRKAGR